MNEIPFHCQIHGVRYFCIGGIGSANQPFVYVCPVYQQERIEILNSEVERFRGRRKLIGFRNPERRK